MSRQLPAKPNLEHLKKQAKELLHDFQQGAPAAIERFRSLTSPSALASPKLADAQHVLARDYGFASWPKFKEHVESLIRVLERRAVICSGLREQREEGVPSLAKLLRRRERG